MDFDQTPEKCNFVAADIAPVHNFICAYDCSISRRTETALVVFHDSKKVGAFISHVTLFTTRAGRQEEDDREDEEDKNWALDIHDRSAM